ncbi:MAG: hypothetical protein ACYCOU_12045, partial [Sulfobacillus sp.]
FMESSCQNWNDFATKGLHQNPQLDRIWRVSRILELSPFSDDILNLTDFEIDFIFRKYAEDNPATVKYTDGRNDSRNASRTRVEWSNLLMGAELDLFVKNPIQYVENRKLAACTKILGVIKSHA